MFFPDPFGRSDDARDDSLRRRARWACRLVGAASALALLLGPSVASLECEAFAPIALIVMLAALTASYVL